MVIDIKCLLGAFKAAATAISGLGVVPKLVRRPREGAEVGVVGYTQLDSYSCGFVAALEALHTLKPPPTPHRRFKDAIRLWRDLGPNPQNGVSQTRLIRSLRRRGIRVGVRRDLDLAKIIAAVDAGMPVITTVNTSDPETDHWTVVHGYSRRPNLVHLSNTAVVRGVWAVLSWREFVSGWTDSGFGLVCSVRARRRKTPAPTRGRAPPFSRGTVSVHAISVKRTRHQSVTSMTSLLAPSTSLIIASVLVIDLLMPFSYSASRLSRSRQSTEARRWRRLNFPILASADITCCRPNSRAFRRRTSSSSHACINAGAMRLRPESIAATSEIGRASCRERV